MARRMLIEIIKKNQNNREIIDTSFGNQGKVIRDLEGFTSLYDFKLVQQADGKIAAIIKGYHQPSSKEIIRFIRFHSNGEIDTSFGNNGVLNYDMQSISYYSYYYSFTILPNGDILLGGGDYSHPHKAIIRKFPSTNYSTPTNFFSYYFP
ncbi:MAG: hypothetical protein NZ853_09445 [Leptospiraceae bacterium]|nr:hypothetical protein [Leptospiraceae bacterium]MDW7975654.1 hypothetical protein [Leptospiraceae bacterium]